MAKQDVTVELFYDGAWHEVPVYSSAADHGQDITITRGYSDEQRDEVTPSTCKLTLDNRTGIYNPRNPVSPLYGLAGRNTPIRVTLPGTTTITDNFETSGSPFQITNGAGSPAWARSTTQAHGGIWSLGIAYSEVAKDENRDVSVAVPDGAVSMSFWYWRHNAADDFAVLVDGVEVLRASTDGGGLSTWIEAAGIDVTGASTVTFRHDENGGVAGGVAGSSYIDDLAFEVAVDSRFYGEVSSYSPEHTLGFSVGGRGDAWVSIEAAGILRRLNQGADPLPSALRAYMESQPGALTYFPMEDGSGSTAPSNAIPGGRPPRANDVSFGSDDTLPASAGVMTFNSADSYLEAPIPGRAASGFVSAVLLFKLDAAPSSAMELFQVEVSGTAALMTVTMDSVNWGTNAYQDDGSVLVEDGAALNVDLTEWVALHYGLYQDSPGTIGYAMYWHQVTGGGNAGNAVWFNVGTFSGTLGSPAAIAIKPHAQKAQAKFAHVIVTNEAFPFADNGLVFVVDAWADWETAPGRIARLCADAGVSFTYDGARSTQMGVLLPATLTELLNETQRTNDGLLFEPRDHLGLHMRTRYGLYNREPALTLDYAAEEIADPFVPVVDDLASRNDVTAERPLGGSARAVLEAGPMSVQEPPDGIGRYATSLDLNPSTDAILALMASWALYKGTLDEIRYPRVTVDVDKVPDAALVDVGDVIALTNLPAYVSPDDAMLLVLGYTEVIGSHRRLITFNCMPARAYEVGVWDETETATSTRWGSGTTARPGVTPIDSTQTSIIFESTSGVLWTEDPAHFPFDVMVGGERMTVTDISPDTGNRQEFTVVRSVNGVVKEHPAGVQVDLFKPARWAL